MSNKVILNNRAYNSIEEASMHLRVPAKDLRAKLEKDRKAKEKTPDFAWEHWGFSELGSTDDMVDYEMFLDGLQTRTLEDIAKEDLEALDAEELELMTELASCLEAIVTEMEETVNEMEEVISKEEIEKTLLQFEHDVLSQATFPEEEKESAGPWVKHND